MPDFGPAGVDASVMCRWRGNDDPSEEAPSGRSQREETASLKAIRSPWRPFRIPKIHTERRSEETPTGVRAGKAHDPQSRYAV